MKFTDSLLMQWVFLMTESTLKFTISLRNSTIELCYIEKDNVSGNEFTIETNEMIDKFKQAKREQGYEEKVISHLRLKKLFIDYIIPATDRVFEINEEDGSEVKVITKGAIILAVGYNNL